jgi:hypothetical protein
MWGKEVDQNPRVLSKGCCGVKGLVIEEIWKAELRILTGRWRYKAIMRFHDTVVTQHVDGI